MRVLFSHRPAAGISVGAYSDHERLYVTVAIANDGTSRKGIFHANRRDAFSHKEARRIIRGRLSDMVFCGKTIDEGLVFETPMAARAFMGEFREVFKPTPDETDDVLAFVSDFAGCEVRSRPTANELFSIVANLANVVVANTSAGV